MTPGLQDLARRLGGALYDGGRRALVPGPGHRPGDRSLSLRMVGERLLVHSFAGDSWSDIRAHLQAAGVGPDLGRASAGASSAPADGLSRPERVARARNLWDLARPCGGTLADRHVRRRGVTSPLSEALRFHPAVPSAVYAGAGRRRPALLAAVRDRAGALCAVELVYLAADGSAASLQVPRKIVGELPPGAAVRLDPPAEILLVGEGVFSTLSAAEALGLPGWALLSVVNLKRWTPPAGVRRLVIAGDRGGPGEAGAAALAARAEDLGLGVAVRLPPVPWEDWNAWALRRGPAG